MRHEQERIGCILRPRIKRGTSARTHDRQSSRGAEGAHRRDGLQLEPDGGYMDDGWSGTNLQRPALEKLRDAVAGGEVERIYVTAPDRLARRHAHQVLLIEEFRRSGAEIDIPEPSDQPYGGGRALAAGSGQIIAEYERTKIFRSARGAGVGMPLAVARSPH